MGTIVIPASEGEQWLWRTAQWIVVAATLVLLGGLVLRPEVSLDLLWELIIPLLPATFLMTPLLWRNVCPLATFNLLPRREIPHRLPSARYRAVAGVGAVLLLWTLVMARRVVFNTDGPILAGVVLAVSGLALALGFVFDGKSGFCNALCPVLPVESLYGQRPLLQLRHSRCVPCNGCMGVCLDLTPRVTALEQLGKRRGARWLLTPYGIFAASFPGFVTAYFTTTDIPVAQAPGLVVWFLGLMLLSWVLVWLTVLVTGLSPSLTLLLLGGLAVGIYYGFAAPKIAAYLQLGPMAGEVLRVACWALILLWAWKGLRREPLEPITRSAA